MESFKEDWGGEAKGGEGRRNLTVSPGRCAGLKSPMVPRSPCRSDPPVRSLDDMPFLVTSLPARPFVCLSRPPPTFVPQQHA